MKSYLITSTKKSSGKTIITIGLAAALYSMKYKLSVFKKGPDYIDPLWISKSAKAKCYNLDFNTMSNHEIKNLYKSKILNSSISIVEGNKGLFDGVSLDGSDSNAALANLLKLEIILIIDCSGMTRGIAPLVTGYKQFDPKLKYKGIILNNIASDRHEGKVISTINEYTDLKVFGSVHKKNELKILEQHLGLEPSFVKSDSNSIIKKISSVIKSSVDMKYLVKDIKKNTTRKTTKVLALDTKKYSGIKIGIPLDRAFGFYYADDIEKFESFGVKIKYFNTLNDKSVPNVDALFIGGGFPELVADKLSLNTDMMGSIKDFIDSNKPVYAECGGLMYLAKSIKINKKTYKMVGAINGKIIMHAKPIGRGLVELIKLPSHPWLESNNIINAHEFHYSDIMLSPKVNNFTYEVQRGYGINSKYDGVKYKNLLATYSHLRDTKKNGWVEKYLKFIKKNKDNETKDYI